MTAREEADAAARTLFDMNCPNIAVAPWVFDRMAAEAWRSAPAKFKRRKDPARALVEHVRKCSLHRFGKGCRADALQRAQSIIDTFTAREEYRPLDDEPGLIGMKHDFSTARIRIAKLAMERFNACDYHRGSMARSYRYSFACGLAHSARRMRGDVAKLRGKWSIDRYGRSIGTFIPVSARSTGPKVESFTEAVYDTAGVYQGSCTKWRALIRPYWLSTVYRQPFQTCEGKLLLDMIKSNEPVKYRKKWYEAWRGCLLAQQKRSIKFSIEYLWMLYKPGAEEAIRLPRHKYSRKSREFLSRLTAGVDWFRWDVLRGHHRDYVNHDHDGSRVFALQHYFTGD